MLHEEILNGWEEVAGAQQNLQSSHPDLGQFFRGFPGTTLRFVPG
jgi:hypothetical protein